MSTPTTASINIRRLALVIAFAALVALGALIAFAITQARSGGPNLDLEPAPDFTVPLYSGGASQFTLSDQRGHPVVLNFWASWCPPCRAEFPALQATADLYRDRGLVVFGVNVQDSEGDARAFLAQQKTTFPTGPDLDGQIALDYLVTDMPTTYFITRNGRIYTRWVGLIDKRRLTALVEELL